MSTPSTGDNDCGNLEENERRQFQNAIEVALTLGDFQKEVNKECTVATINEKAVSRIRQLVPFEASAIYLLDDTTYDLTPSLFKPAEARTALEAEMEFLVEEGFVSWAIRERRGISIFSKDNSRQIFLHVMATYSRIRGLFVGMFPPRASRLPEASLEMISLVLRNAVNAIESQMHSTLLRQRKEDLEKELEEKTKQLLHYEKNLMQAQQSEAIAALAGGVAHEFNNALSGLVGNIDLVSMKFQATPEVATYINRIRPIIERMTRLTGQLLAYAQGGTCMGKVISLEALFNHVMPAIKHALGDQIRLDVELDAASTTVDVDMIQFRMVMLAIVNNAKEATENNGRILVFGRQAPWDQIPERVRDELAPGDYACIGIEDNGSGMDEGTLRRLFDPFFSTKFTGRGLSMAAVSGIIKRHKGCIDASSSPGSGTCIRVYLPQVTAA